MMGAVCWKTGPTAGGTRRPQRGAVRVLKPLHHLREQSAVAGGRRRAVRAWLLLWRLGRTAPGWGLLGLWLACSWSAWAPHAEAEAPDAEPPAASAAAEPDAANAEAEADAQAVEAGPVTTRYLDAPVAELELRVKPLTAEELAVEAAAWRKLLHAKTHEITVAQVAVYRANEAMTAAREQDAQTAAAVVQEAAEEMKAVAEQVEAEQAEAGAEPQPIDPAVDLDAGSLDAGALDAGAAEQPPANDAEPAEGADSPAEPSAEAGAEASAEAGAEPGAEAGALPGESAEPRTRAEALRAKADQVAAEAAAAVETGAGAEAVAQIAADAKQGLLDRVTRLREEQTAIIDRYNVVLGSWEAKGGDGSAHRQYIKAVAGIDVDVSDTSAAWAAVKGWLVSEKGGQRWLWNLLRFLGVLVGTWVVARVFGRVLHVVIARFIGKVSKLAENVLIRSLKMLIWVIGLVVALSMLQVDITPLLAAIGAAGLVIGLALQGTLSNIASGVMILINRPFDVDDIVSAGGVTGKISEMTLVTTIFRTFDNQTVIVPNNEIWGQVITNITANDIRRVDLVFGVSYGDDLDRAERIMRQVVEAHELVLDDPEPMIKVHELADSSVNFICRPWAKTEDYWTVFWDLTRQVKQRFDAEGVSIPFPQRDVHVHHHSLETAPEQAH